MDFSYLDSLLEEEETVPDAIQEAGDGYRNAWVVAEVVQGQLSRPTLETLGQARELADQIGIYVYGVLLGSGEDHLTSDLASYGADRVLWVKDPRLDEYQPETFTAALAELVERYRPEILLLPATSLGSDLAPRLAQRLNTGLLSHCVKVAVDMSQRMLLGTSQVLGGDVFHTYDCPTARPQMASLEPGWFRTPYPDTYRQVDVQTVDVDLGAVSSRLVWKGPSQKPELPAALLRKARVVVGIGRGLSDRADLACAEQLAAALGGVLAGSRGAIDLGWITEEQLVGVGGELIAPDLYIACGISGDIHHTFGLQNARFVVAINTDENAPIMKAANLAVVGDARQVIPALLDALTG